jgi:hypothetical protein
LQIQSESLVSEEEKKSELIRPLNKGVISVHSKVSEENQVDANVSIGLMEGEITDHSIRKIMEGLIKDFPISIPHDE